MDYINVLIPTDHGPCVVCGHAYTSHAVMLNDIRTVVMRDGTCEGEDGNFECECLEYSWK